ncbi:MAG: hypothetical protein H7Y28_03070 [Rhodoferax sp.]|nr:hypothetical protein [Rhodoferax sp.]
MQKAVRRVLRVGLRWGLAWAFACAAQAHTVVVVTSDANAGGVETADIVVAELLRLGLHAEDIGRTRAADIPRIVTAKTDTRVYLTLGVESLREVLKANVREPVVAALIPRTALERTVGEFGKRSGAALSALYLDQPLGRQLDLLRLALPDAKRVGLVLGPESLAQQASTVAAIRARGMEPVVGIAVTAENIFAGLKPALEDSQVLLAVPDSLVFNNGTVSSILTATYRARIPLIAFSPAYVRAGALLCVYSTPQQIGAQAAAMVQAQLRGSNSVPSQYPLEFNVRVNDSVARSLGLSLREDQLSEQLRRMERKP